MELCEIRIPTYKRPHLLKRALQSLTAQTYCYWKALVMDDSPSQEAKPLVTSFNDERIIYSPNPKNLGSAANLDRAFKSHSLIDGTYACVLEDDNWLKPNYLSENISSLKKQGVEILLRNQEIWIQTENFSTPTTKTTGGNWFTSKIYTPIQLHAFIFFFQGISNGGLFWKTSIKSNLQVGSSVGDAGLQEYCRSLQIQENLYFDSNPLCYWSEMPSTLSLRNPISNRIFGRGLQSIKMNLIKKYGVEILKESENIAYSCNKLDEFESALIDALYVNYHFKHTNKIKFFRSYFKSFFKNRLLKDPLQKYFLN